MAETNEQKISRMAKGRFFRGNMGAGLDVV